MTSSSPSPTPILILDRVSKRFAGHTAVDDLSLSVPRGVIYGLLGPNGAGKTTTIRMIMDILRMVVVLPAAFGPRDRKSTRLNFSHANISYTILFFKQIIVRIGLADFTD